MMTIRWLIWLIIGQSNNKTGGNMIVGRDVPSLNVWQMRSDDTLGIAIDPLDYPDKSASISAGIAGAVLIGYPLVFARDYYGPARLGTNERVLLVPCAQNGTALVGGPWAVNGALYLEAIRRANLAMAIPGAEFMGILWHQGESDALASTPSATYQAALDAMVAGFRAAITGATNSKFIVGPMVPDWITDTAATGGSFGTRTAVAINAVHIDTPNRIFRAAFASATSPTEITTPDPTFLHYDDDGQIALAGRYYTAENTIVANEVNYYSTTYVPGVPWDHAADTGWNVPRGSGVPFELVANPAQQVLAGDYSATVSLYDGTKIPFSVALLNMTVNTSTGVILVNPTFAQTIAWEGVAFLDLWQTGAGDDNRTHLKRKRLNMYYAGSPSA